jgi:CRISPR-associated protein Cas1
MPSLYVTEPGSLVRREGERLVVERDGRTLLSAPCLQVERVLLFGPVQLSSGAVALLLSRGIAVAFFSSGGQLRGVLSRGDGRNVSLRLAQYQAARDAGHALRLARAIVAGKVGNSRAVVERYARNHREFEGAACVARLRALEAQAARKNGVGGLRGVEGAAAACYFGALRGMTRRAGWESQRRERPPRDGLNALLSLAYTLAAHEIRGVLQAIGLDAHVGFLHGISYGRASLALDLLEEFRAPLCDRFALALINRRVIAPGDFEVQDGGSWRLSEPALKRFLRAYEAALHAPFRERDGTPSSFRRLFHAQARRLSNAIRDGSDYQPYRHR